MAGRAAGSRASSCTTCARAGIEAIVERTLEVVGAGPVFLTRRRGRARPGLRAGDRHARAGRDDARPTCSGPAARSRRELELVGADVVEVIPTAVGSADITALVADRIVREILNGLALRRRNER